MIYFYFKQIYIGFDFAVSRPKLQLSPPCTGTPNVPPNAVSTVEGTHRSSWREKSAQSHTLAHVDLLNEEQTDKFLPFLAICLKAFHVLFSFSSFQFLMSVFLIHFLIVSALMKLWIKLKTIIGMNDYLISAESLDLLVPGVKRLHF